MISSSTWTYTNYKFDPYLNYVFIFSLIFLQLQTYWGSVRLHICLFKILELNVPGVLVLNCVFPTNCATIRSEIIGHNVLALIPYLYLRCSNLMFENRIGMLINSFQIHYLQNIFYFILSGSVFKETHNRTPWMTSPLRCKTEQIVINRLWS